MTDDESDSDEFEVRTIEVGTQPLRVAIRRGPKGRPPLLLFNGIGASLGAREALHARVEAHRGDHFRRARSGRIAAPPRPYRPSTIARLAERSS